MTKSKSYTKEFKFKVAIEMIRGDKTLNEISAKYMVPKSVACRWKKQLLDSGAYIFDSKKQQAISGFNNNYDIEKLHATIGKLKVENDFLQIVSSKLEL